MKVKVFGMDGKETGSKDLPKQFDEEVRPDLIKRAAEVIQANKRQKYGVTEEAGKRHSTYLSKRRRAYRGAYGAGRSRTPRKIVSRRGERINYVGAFAPNTVGGRVAHPPKAEKKWELKINKKENRKAIRSALAASVAKEFVEARGHRLPENFPFVFDNKFEAMKKTVDVKKALKIMGLKDELVRAEVKNVRAGKGKLRGRKYKRRVGPLVVVGDKCDLLKAAKNIPGVDVVKVNEVNALMLAPGCNPGRLTIFTVSALENMEKNKLFM